jgi:hypothetical protein
MRRFIPATAAAAAIIVLLSGCGPSGPTASASVIEKAVNIQPASGDPRPVATASPVSVAETVQTDKAGLSEVVFADASYTRVGPSSVLTIVELSSAEAQRTVTRLDVGESWHRVKEIVAEDGAYQVDTPVGVASVRGTAFAVVCATKAECQFTVIEGNIEVELDDGVTFTVKAFERLTVPRGEIVPFPIDLAKADAWIMKNLTLDGVELAEAATAEGIEDWKASLAGTWHAVYTVTAESDPRRAGNVGTSFERSWVATTGDCTPSGCTLVIVSNNAEPFDIAVTPSGMTWETTGQAQCFDEVTEELRTEYGFDMHTLTELQPTTVETTGGIPTTTEMNGTRTVTWTLRNPPDPNCVDAALPVVTQTMSVVVTRTDR